MATPIAYTYEADTHCPPCTAERFGPACEGTDREGNAVGALFSWDEWCNPPEPGKSCILVCGTCGDIIRSHEWLEAHA